MTLANGREFLSIPGPTTVPDQVLGAMHRPAIDIYSGELLAVTASCLADLRRVFRTEGRVSIYGANGHGAWEAALVNVLSKGDRVLVLESGLFATVWGEMSRSCAGIGAAGSIPGRGGPACASIARVGSRPSWWSRSTPPPAASTT